MPCIVVGTGATIQFIPSGMNKNGTWTLSGSSTETVVTGWVADTAGYPGSTLSGNGLVVQDATTNGKVAISVECVNTHGSSTVNLTLRVQKGGSPWVTFDVVPVPPGSVPTVFERSVSGVTVAPGDVLTLTGQITNTLGERRITSGWLRITLP